MAPSLLVSDQSRSWDVQASPLSAFATWDAATIQTAGPVSPPLESEEWSNVISLSSTCSPFEYQRAILNAVWRPVAKSHSPERHHPEKAQRALEQIRALHRKQEGRRQEQAESEWIAANRTHFAGQWVAIVGGELIAAGQSAREVAQIAAGAPSTPLIILIENELPFAGW